MKIVIASVRDTGGTGWNLAHAINRVTPENRAIDLTAQKSYINYPTMADMANYDLSTVRQMICNADVVVMLGAFKPLFEGLKLKTAKMKDQKKLLLFMGSEWRYGKKELMKQAKQLIKSHYDIAIGGPGMYASGKGEDGLTIDPTPDFVKYLPFTRGFSEIRSKYSMCGQDHRAVEAFGIPRKRVVFMHAPTSELRKGSETFYRAVTKAMQMVPTMTFSSVRGQPWVSCLKALASADVLLDQDPPFPEAYGAISVEASIFKMPVVTRIDPDAATKLKELTGWDHPFIQWKDDDDLLEKIYKLGTDPKLRRYLGQKAYDFAKAIHDEKPVVDRFMKIVDEID